MFQTSGMKQKGYTFQRKGTQKETLLCPISLLDVAGQIMMGIFVGRLVFHGFQTVWSIQL